MFLNEGKLYNDLYYCFTVCDSVCTTKVAYKLHFRLNKTGRYEESFLNIDYLDTLSSWATNQSLCVCPEDSSGNRYPLCSIKEDVNCVGGDEKPGETVKTGSRDERSLVERDVGRDDVRERLAVIRHKRDAAISQTRRVKVRL